MPRSVGHFKMFSGLVADGGSRYRQALDHETHGTISGAPGVGPLGRQGTRMSFGAWFPNIARSLSANGFRPLH